MKKKFYLLIIICGLFLFYTNVYATSTATVDEIREAVVETAEAYYRKGTYVQYDSFRKSGVFTPEDATSQNTIYSVCSDFTYMIFYNTLGIKIPYTTEHLNAAAKNKKDSANVILYVEGDDVYSVNGIGTVKTDTKNRVKQLSEEVLQVGDIINAVDSTGHGHVMLYVGVENDVAYVLESEGSAYDTNNSSDILEPNGSIKKTKLTDQVYYYHNMKDDGKSIVSFSIMRFINPDFTYISEDAGYPIKTYGDLTSSARTRLNYKKIDINKTSKVTSASGNNSRRYASPDDSITYTIEIKNSSSTSYNNLQVVEKLDENVKLVNDGGATRSGNTLTWNIDAIAPSTIKEITYTVKIPNNSNMIGKYVTSTGTVGNIATHNINHYIGNSLNNTEKNKLISKYSEIYQTQEFYGMAFVNELYKALNIDFSNLNGKTFSQILTSDDCGDDLCGLTINNDLARKMNFNNLYGIRLSYNFDIGKTVLAKKVWDFYDYDDKIDRARDITTSDLQIGDIIITPGESPNDEIYAYIYIDEGKLSRRYADGTTYANLVYRDGTNGNITIDEFLANITCDSYIILRPAQLLSRQYNNINNPVDVPDTGKNANIVITFLAISMILIGVYSINYGLKKQVK